MPYEAKTGTPQMRRRPRAVGRAKFPTKGLRLDPRVVEMLDEMAVFYKLSECQLLELVIESLHAETMADAEGNSTMAKSLVAGRLESLRRLIHSPATDGPRQGAVVVPESPSTRAA